VSNRAVVTLGIVLALLPFTRVRAEVRTLTLGITVNCPYGLAS
jgi:hypothetical protein